MSEPTTIAEMRRSVKSYNASIEGIPEFVEWSPRYTPTGEKVPANVNVNLLASDMRYVLRIEDLYVAVTNRLMDEVMNGEEAMSFEDMSYAAVAAVCDFVNEYVRVPEGGGDGEGDPESGDTEGSDKDEPSDGNEADGSGEDGDDSDDADGSGDSEGEDGAEDSEGEPGDTESDGDAGPDNNPDGKREDYEPEPRQEHSPHEQPEFGDPDGITREQEIFKSEVDVVYSGKGRVTATKRTRYDF